MPKGLSSRVGGRMREISSPIVDRRGRGDRRDAARVTSDRRGIRGRLDAIPDVPDFRDRMYEPSLVEVPSQKDLKDYQALGVPILDQGNEGACTGFALASAAHYLLLTRDSEPSKDFNKLQVSPWMFYAMAKRYDEWPGETYEGSSARGAMKAWHKHGVCHGPLWMKTNQALTAKQAADAALRPLGAYYRVNHKDLVSMHSALADVGVLYVTSSVHEGWRAAGKTGVIKLEPGSIGGHAFIIVAYDRDGFWIQNSWGKAWGKGGFAHLSYDDWLLNGDDAWVARLGAPVALSTAEGTSRTVAVGSTLSKSIAFHDLRPHIVSIGNDGNLRRTGPFGLQASDIPAIVDDIAGAVKKWPVKRILLYAHGGLTSEDGAIAKIADLRRTLIDQQIFPVSFIWKTDYVTTLKNILSDAFRSRRPEGILDASRDFLLDRADDLLEPVARIATGKAEWSEMKENALLASEVKNGQKGGARLFLEELFSRGSDFEFHIVGHSAGSIFHAGVTKVFAQFGRRIKTCTLWAPACTMELFHKRYVPLIKNNTIEKFAVFTLTDKAEQDDNCANIYHKSLLYLVAHAFEDEPRIPVIKPRGTPLLGMQKFIEGDPVAANLFANGANWVTSPNAKLVGSAEASGSISHGGFDDDKATLHATLARILGVAQVAPQNEKVSASPNIGERRQAMNQVFA